MFKNCTLAVVFIAVMMLCAQCSDNKTTEPASNNSGDAPPTVIDISGYTWTDYTGYVLNVDGSIDADDWCYSALPASPNKSTIPDEYALYPAYPNPTLQQIMFLYDIPAAGNVDVYIIDTNQTVIKRLVSTHLDAGRYFTYWDRTDTVGVEVAPGLYRAIMAAGDFECHGDVKMLSQSTSTTDSLTIQVTDNGTSLTLAYSCDVPVGGVILSIFFDDQVQDPNFYVAAHKMDYTVFRSGNNMRIIILPKLMDPLQSMPAGANVPLCTMSFTGNVLVSYADAADTGSGVLKTFIVSN
ncbi:MAG: hypothetical protein R3F48_06860 [Candidatus Zixiibacteriota bacterium]